MIGLPEVPTFQYTMTSSEDEQTGTKDSREMSSDDKLTSDGQAAGLLGSQDLIVKASVSDIEAGSITDVTQR